MKIAKRPFNLKYFLNNLKDDTYVTYIFIAINVIVFLVAAVLGVAGLANTYGAAPAFEMSGVHLAVQSELVFQAGQWWRLFTAMFGHFGLVHIALNCVTIYFFGRQIENLYGHARFTIIYLVSGIVGNAAALGFSAPGTWSAGASTSVFGLFGAMIVLYRYFRDNPQIRQMSRQLMSLVIMNIVIDLMIPGISLAGHIGGFIGGILVGAALAIKGHEHRYNVHERILAGIFTVFVIAVSLYVAYRRSVG
ncbi:MAG: rhomboid family intramembrane serine protease [Lactobacillales bacterium]|jgi:rhomboid protease GluP|nr:rhomboid family intramembrane serine protease [Lactobacillales bacterium]